MTTPLLEGLDGVNKMSKSLNNYIGIDEDPNEMFGKVMSISDDLIWKYYERLTDKTVDEINALKFKCESGEENPRNLKVVLAKSIIRDFHSEQAANDAEAEFNHRFVNKEIPDDIDEQTLAAGSYKLVELLSETALAASKGEAKRLITQGGVKVNGEKQTDTNSVVELNGETLLQVGKLKYLRIISE